MRHSPNNPHPSNWHAVLVDPVGIWERAERFTKRSIKGESKLVGLRLAVSMCDLTTLEGTDTVGKIVQLCARARRPDPLDATIPSVAAVCVYPPFVRQARSELNGSEVKVASVATAFPSGQLPLELRAAEVKYAVDEGADEIDMVINRGAFLSGQYNLVHDEIAAIKEICGRTQLKVILETGDLESYDNIRQASTLAMRAGADFVKTSTGKVQPAATLPVTLVMLEAIRDYFFATGRKVGMKPAGGIRTAKQALHYLVAVKETLGDEWLTPDLFRFGASTLLTDLQMQLAKQRQGQYQSVDYLGLD